MPTKCLQWHISKFLYKPTFMATMCIYIYIPNIDAYVFNFISLQPVGDYRLSKRLDSVRFTLCSTYFPCFRFCMATNNMVLYKMHILHMSKSGREGPVV